ncbi:hypothetical protein DSO57_1007303 [Entomophthora muscae]|uniref:Uncharacterized protein n=1 Tax=Entomophthora muscae TaxID=34485 RepID=A0ACC2RM43_9FUNG|nr:hypothetical protein DSO57_1007303 [Entomophthora muscae]
MGFFIPSRISNQLHAIVFHINRSSDNFSKGPWSLKESEALKEAVTKLDQSHSCLKRRPQGFWSEVSKRVSTRNSRQCFTHWSSVFSSKDTRRRPFTLDEDLAILGLPEDVPSSVIKRALPGRTILQFRTRRRAITSGIIPWSTLDLEKLETCVEAHGPSNFTKISKLVKSQSSFRCTGRWVPNRYTSGLNKGNLNGDFTLDEKIIFSRLSFFLGKISGVLLFFPGRTYHQLYRFSTSLFKHKMYTEKFSGEGLYKLFDLFLANGFDWENIVKEFPSNVSSSECATLIKYVVASKGARYIPPNILEALSIKYFQCISIGQPDKPHARRSNAARSQHKTFLENNYIL